MKSEKEIQLEKVNKHRVNLILKIVEANTGLKPKLNLNKRHRHLVDVRSLTMYLIRENTTLSLHRIGKIFKKDHSSVLHGSNSFSNLMNTQNQYKDLYLNCSRQFRELVRQSVSESLPIEAKYALLLSAFNEMNNKYVTLKGEMNKAKYIVERLPKQHQQKFKNERIFCNNQ